MNSTSALLASTHAVLPESICMALLNRREVASDPDSSRMEERHFRLATPPLPPREAVLRAGETTRSWLTPTPDAGPAEEAAGRGPPRRGGPWRRGNAPAAVPLLPGQAWAPGPPGSVRTAASAMLERVGEGHVVVVRLLWRRRAGHRGCATRRERACRCGPWWGGAVPPRPPRPAPLLEHVRDRHEIDLRLRSGAARRRGLRHPCLLPGGCRLRSRGRGLPLGGTPRRRSHRLDRLRRRPRRWLRPSGTPPRIAGQMGGDGFEHRYDECRPHRLLTVTSVRARESRQAAAHLPLFQTALDQRSGERLYQRVGERAEARPRLGQAIRGREATGRGWAIQCGVARRRRRPLGGGGAPNRGRASGGGTRGTRARRAAAGGGANDREGGHAVPGGRHPVPGRRHPVPVGDDAAV